MVVQVLVLGFLAVLIVVGIAFLPRGVQRSTMRPCPSCGTRIEVGEIACTRCGTMPR
jgi:hypothetical protein